jgi:hypothetical protein
MRYAIDAARIESEFDRKAEETFDTGPEKIIHWIIENEARWGPIRASKHSCNRLSDAVPRNKRGEKPRRGQIPAGRTLAGDPVRERYESITLGRPELDLADEATLEAAMCEHALPRWSTLPHIPPADKAKSETDASFAINRDGAGALAAEAA